MYACLSLFHSEHVEEYFTELGVKMDISSVVEKGDSSVCIFTVDIGKKRSLILYSGATNCSSYRDILGREGH